MDDKKINVSSVYGTTGDDPRPMDGYDLLLVSIRQKFARAVEDNKRPIFRTDAGRGLYDILISALPEEARQHYTCNACRYFVDHYGGLVVIDEGDGRLIPIMWNPNQDTVGEFFAPAVMELFNKVRTAKIIERFYTQHDTLGTPVTGKWMHMSVPGVPAYIQVRSDQVSSRIAESREDHAMLARAIAGYSEDVLKKAQFMFNTGCLARADVALPQIEWLLKVKADCEDKDVIKKNILWYHSATAPTGMCHVANTALGQLLDGIRLGKDADIVEKMYNNMTDPQFYKRPKAAPTSGQVKIAEQRVAELGIANSLKRRYARLDEVKTIWTAPVKEESPNETTGGVFGGLKTKDQKQAETNPIVRKQVINISWVKFLRDILPTAERLFFIPGYNRCNFGAAVTAVDMDAPPIIKWDTEENRNPISWYSHVKGADPRVFNLRSGGEHEIVAISEYPDAKDDGKPHVAMLIIKDCRDVSGTKGLGLFPDILKSELYDIRAVIEAFSNTNTLEGADEASACGIVVNGRGTGGLVGVKTKYGEAYYNIGRME